MTNRVYKGQRYEPVELTFTSAMKYEDAFNEIDLDVVVSDDRGSKWIIPAFWAGGQIWIARFSAPKPGRYQFSTECTNPEDRGLQSVAGEIEITEYEGTNPLYIHGPIRIMENGRYFEHEDGTPFVYMGDTWHPLMTSRINNTDEVELLAADREKKGFTIIEFLNGFMCDVMLWDRRLTNEVGYAWTEDLRSINPWYYNVCEPKIQCIINHGMMLCITGSWGFYIKNVGVERMKKHFRYMVARWAAYPVMWTLAGETLAPSYDMQPIMPDEPRYHEWEKEIRPMWSEVLAYLRTIDPYHRLITTHVSHGNLSCEEVDNPELLDVNIFQGAIHSEDYTIISHDVKHTSRRGYRLKPVRPVINQETCYEGMLYTCGPYVQRWLFWHSILEGCAGWMYGANGLFNASHRDDPFGTAHYGCNWGEIPWQEAYQFKGCEEVSRCRKYLNQFEWWQLQPAYDRVFNKDGIDEWQEAVAAEIPGELVIGYSSPFIDLMTPYLIQGMTFIGLTPGETYHTYLYNPIRDYEIDCGILYVNEEGVLQCPKPHTGHDWVYVIRRAEV